MRAELKEDSKEWTDAQSAGPPSACKSPVGRTSGRDQTCASLKGAPGADIRANASATRWIRQWISTST